MARGAGEGRLFEGAEAIILSISVKGGRLFEGGDYFKYFRQRGAIIRGRRLIERRLLFEEIR